MNNIRINNTTISGKSITIKDGKVIVDGTEVNTGDSKTINIEVQGNLESLDADYCHSISVTGHAGRIKTMAGDVNCGDVGGNVQTMSGDIKCGAVSGDVSSMSGDIDVSK